MMAHGLLDEVTQLYNHPRAHKNLTSMQSIGYKQLWLYLQGNLSLKQAELDAQTATRRLAKRQINWLRTIQQIQPADVVVSDSMIVDSAELMTSLGL